MATTEFPAPVDPTHADRDLDLFGVVVREDGSPVPGARVQAVSYPWRRVKNLYTEGAQLERLGPATTTSADGSFSLRLGRGQTVAVRVAATGFAPLELSDRKAGERVRIVLAPGVRLVVRATDERSLPVASATVVVSRMGRPDGPTIARRATTGPDGVASFDDLPGDVRVAIEFESRLGRPGAKLAELPRTGEARIDVVLPPGRTIRGRVTDASTGAGVAGARIGMNWVLDQPVTSQTDGTYELLGWTGIGCDEITCVADGYVRREEEVGERMEIDFALAPGFRVTGRLIDPSGAAVTDACVAVLHSERDGAVQRLSMGYAMTGADGRFAVTGLDRATPHVLTVMAPHVAKLQREVGPPADGRAEIDLGDLALAAPRSIEGRVVTANTASADRIRVSLSRVDAGLPASSSRYGNVEQGVTDDLGRFRFPDLPSGTYEIRAEPANAPELRAVVVLPPDRDVRDVVLSADRTRKLTIRVVDDAGAGVAGAVVQVHGGEGAPPQGTTDAAGTVRIEAPARRLDATVFVVPRDAKGRSFLPHDSFDVPRGGDQELTFVLHVGGSVAGVVLDPEGHPVPHVLVVADGGGDRSFGRPTGPDGSFRLTVPASGALSLVVRGDLISPDGAPAGDVLLEGRVDGVSAGATGVEIRCRRVATGRGFALRVSTPDGRPARGVTVFVQSGRAGGDRTVTTDDDGRATASGLTARPHRVQAAASGGWLGPDPVEVVPEGQEIALTLRAAARITGVVLLPDGTPAVQATVLVLRDGAPVPGATVTRTDEKGAFTALVPAADTGTFTLQASGQDAGGAYAGEASDVRGGESGVRIVAER